jgi:hypothetical protein
MCRWKDNIRTDNELVWYEEVGVSEDDNERSADIKAKLLHVHAMKACRGSRGTAPFILNLRVRWRCQITLKHGKIVQWLIECLAGFEG